MSIEVNKATYERVLQELNLDPQTLEEVENILTFMVMYEIFDNDEFNHWDSLAEMWEDFNG